MILILHISKIRWLTRRRLLHNSNGKTLGITLASAQGQEAVIRKAYRKAGLSESMGETDYIECHGTGTPVGDPIEVEAVSRVFAEHRQERLLIGSVSQPCEPLSRVQILSDQSCARVKRRQLHNPFHRPRTAADRLGSIR